MCTKLCQAGENAIQLPQAWPALSWRDIVSNADVLSRASLPKRVHFAQTHRLILSTQSVGAMLWSMAQLRRGQLRVVVDVVGMPATC